MKNRSLIHSGFICRSLIISLITLIISPVVFGQEVSSPSGDIKVKVLLESGSPFYEVLYKGKTFLEPSPLGFDTSLGSFATGLKNDGSKVAEVNEIYHLQHGKVRAINYKANEMRVFFSNSKNGVLEVIFRVSDRDVALAYNISVRDKYRITINRELTGFNFPQQATAFVTQQVSWGGGFAGTKPSYEEGYMMDVAVGTKSCPGLGFTFPALFRIADNGWVLVSETGVTSKYAGCRLGDPTSDGIYSIAFPEKEENAGIGEANVSGALPLMTPWRTITLGDTLAPIVETTVSTDVVKQLYEPTREYRGGRATWSWILWQDNSMNEKDQRTYIDLASEMGYEYILIDALWDERIGRERMADLVEYAGSKDVGVLLWYNSNGYWNDAPQSPRNCLYDAPTRQQEMAWMRSIGVMGMKVDFFGGDKQVTMKLYEDILTDANLYGLELNFHGATLPRGWERMYPNHMTSEAVTASENLVFSQGFANSEAQNSTIFPFVRNPVSSMDYGPVLLNKVFSRDQRRGTQRRTTDTFQLATAVLFQSSIQHFGLTPNNLAEQPEYVINFLKAVPANWDEVRYIDGYPGKYVVLARRSGSRWYIAATHAGNSQLKLTVSLPWLSGKSLNSIYDSEGGVAALGQVQVAQDGKVDITLAAGGGAVLVYNPYYNTAN